MWIEIILLYVLLFGFLHYIDREMAKERKKKNDRNVNYHISREWFSVTDRETGHILLARNRSGVISSYGIVPERNLSEPLQEWRLGENPFPKNNIYCSTFTDDDGSTFLLKVQPDHDFDFILKRYERQCKREKQ